MASASRPVTSACGGAVVGHDRALAGGLALLAGGCRVALARLEVQLARALRVQLGAGGALCAWSIEITRMWLQTAPDRPGCTARGGDGEAADRDRRPGLARAESRLSPGMASIRRTSRRVPRAARALLEDTRRLRQGDRLRCGGAPASIGASACRRGRSWPRPSAWACGWRPTTAFRCSRRSAWRTCSPCTCGPILRVKGRRLGPHDGLGPGAVAGDHGRGAVGFVLSPARRRKTLSWMTMLPLIQ